MPACEERPAGGLMAGGAPWGSCIQEYLLLFKGIRHLLFAQYYPFGDIRHACRFHADEINAVVEC